MNKILVSAILAIALIGVVDGKSTSSSRPSSSFHSSSSTSHGISLTKSPAPAKSGISLTKPAAPSGGINLTKPAVTPPPASTQSHSWFGHSTPTPPTVNHTVTVVHEHHYFGGGGNNYGHGYYGGYSGGFGSSPFFWLWLLDRPHPQTVYVQGAPGVVAQPAPVPGPSGGEIFFNIVFGLLLLTSITGLIVWGVHKIFFSK